MLNKLKDLTTVGVANGLSTLILVLFWFYMAGLLGTENYGHVSYFIAAASIGYVISLLGGSNTVLVFTAKENKKQPTIHIFPLIISGIAAVITYFIFWNIGVSLFIIGNVVFTLVISELLGEKNYSLFGKVVISQKIFLVVLSIGLYYLIGIDGVILGYAISFYPYFWFIIKSFKAGKIDFGILKTRMHFMLNSYFMDLSRRLSWSADKLIILPLFGFVLLGNYQLGFQFLILLSIIPSSVYQYILPQNSSGKSKEKLKKITILFSVLLALLGVFVAPELVNTFFPQYQETTEIIRIMSLAIIPITINYMYTAKFLGIEKTKFILIGAILFVSIQFAGIYLLGEIFGINGAAISLVLGASSQSIFFVLSDKFFIKDNYVEEKS